MTAPVTSTALPTNAPSAGLTPSSRCSSGIAGSTTDCRVPRARARKPRTPIHSLPPRPARSRGAHLGGELQLTPVRRRGDAAAPSRDSATFRSLQTPLGKGERALLTRLQHFPRAPRRGIVPRHCLPLVHPDLPPACPGACAPAWSPTLV